MNWFYQPEIPTGNHTLQDEEFRHCVKVLRKKTGDEIQLIDGKGKYYIAIIDSIEKHRCTFTIKNVEEEPQRTYTIHLAVAPTKNQDRLEWFVEKAIEFGVDQISFIQCVHSERTTVKQERIDRIAVSAMKQSGRATLPGFSPLTSLKLFMDSEGADQKFIAHVDQQNQDHLLQKATPGKKYIVLIGPEGDFSEEEIDLALTNGFQKISLGNYRLRTETAAIAACQILHLVNV